MHQARGDINDLRFAEQACVDFGLQRAVQPAPCLNGIGRRTGGPAGIAAKGKELVGRCGVDKAAHEIGGGERVDRPGPAQIDSYVAIVFGQRQDFATIGVGDMHEYKATVQIARQQRAEVAALDAVDGHAVVAGVVAGVDFEGQIVFASKLNAARPAPVAQEQALVFGQFGAGQRLAQHLFGLCIGALAPA